MAKRHRRQWNVNEAIILVLVSALGLIIGLAIVRTGVTKPEPDYCASADPNSFALQQTQTVLRVGWIVRNCGMKVWDVHEVHLVKISDPDGIFPQQIDLTNTTPPGGNIRIILPAAYIPAAGSYRPVYQMEVNGTPFGERMIPPIEVK